MTTVILLVPLTVEFRWTEGGIPARGYSPNRTWDFSALLERRVSQEMLTFVPQVLG